jgi:hypothetical protein
VAHAENDGHLHLVRVGEDERVLTAVPTRVETEGVDMAVELALRLLVGVREVPARVE